MPGKETDPEKPGKPGKPSISEICSWIGKDESTRSHWVDKGLCEYVTESTDIERIVVEMFIVPTLVDAIKIPHARQAWVEVREEVIAHASVAATRLDLVWLETPPEVRLIRTDEEMLSLVRESPRRLIVFQLAPLLQGAVKTLRFHERGAWAEKSAELAALMRRQKSGGRSGRPSRHGA